MQIGAHICGKTEEKKDGAERTEKNRKEAVRNTHEGINRSPLSSS